MVELEQWVKNPNTGETVLVKKIKREARTAELLLKHGKGWQRKSAPKESHAVVSSGPKVSKSEKIKVEEPVVEEHEVTEEKTEAFTGVSDLTLDKAKKFIKLTSDIEKLNFIVNNDGRKNVVNAAKERIKELK